MKINTINVNYIFTLAFLCLMTIASGAHAQSPVAPAIRAMADATANTVTNVAPWSQRRAVFVKPSQDALREKLTKLQFEVTQKDATEPPFNNEYWDNKGEGLYVDIVSGEPLFSSTDKYRSGTGWPSFTRPITADSLVEKPDISLLGIRTELRSSLADSHLGHVFDDGPAPTGLRYCINSAALRFVSKERLVAEGYAEFQSLFE